MIKIISVFAFLILSRMSFAGDNVVVLVDVSGSIGQELFNKAKETSRKFILGESIENSGFRLKILSDSFYTANNKLISPGNKLIIIPFGSRDRTYDASQIVRIRITETERDVNNAFENYPAYSSDGLTYLRIARPRAGKISYIESVFTYYLLFISDNESDIIKNGPAYTPIQDSLIYSFGDQKHIVQSINVARLISESKPNYQILVEKVDISKWNPDTNLIKKDNEPIKQEPSLRLNNYAGGKTKYPVEYDKMDINLSWTCSNCPPNVVYSVRCSAPGVKTININNINTENSVRINFPEDETTYNIQVTGRISESQSMSTTTVIHVSEGGFPTILLILLLLVIVFILLWWLKKKRIEKQNQSKKQNVI